MMRRLACATTIALALCAPAASQEASLAERLQSAPQIGDGERYVRFSPFVEFDGAFFETSPDTLRPAGEGREGEIRRARLYTDFQFDDLGGRLTLDFAEWREAPFRYAYLNYAVSDDVLLQGGHQTLPFSMQETMGSRSALFAEDGPNEIFGTSTALGAAAFVSGEAWSLSGGVFGGDVNRQAFDDGVVLSGRGTAAPYLTDASAVHLGLGLAAGFDRQEPLSFEGGVGSNLSSIVPIETDPFDGSVQTLAVNGEFAALFDRFTLQSEYTLTQIDAQTGGSALFHGGYLGALWFLTDDRREYDAGAGEFGQVEPARPLDEGGLGAFEIGARLEALDLSDVSEGGRTLGATAIANWYPTNVLRFTASHTLTEVTSGPDEGERINATLLRAAIVY